MRGVRPRLDFLSPDARFDASRSKHPASGTDGPLTTSLPPTNGHLLFPTLLWTRFARSLSREHSGTNLPSQLSRTETPPQAEVNLNVELNRYAVIFPLEKTSWM